MIKKLSEIFIISLIFFGIGWFGMAFGPQERDAHATVFEKLFNYTEAMPAYLYDDKNSIAPRKVIVNNNTTYLSVSRTQDSIKKALDFYEKQINWMPVSRIEDEAIKQADDATKEKFKAANRLLEWIKSQQRFRMEKKNYGYLGAFEFRDPDVALGSKEFFEILSKGLETGNIGDIGIGRMVIAMRGKQEKNTTIIKIWTDSDFNINNMRPDETGDMPGQDIKDVPRYPGSQRMMSLAQENLKTFDSIVAYRNEGSQAANVIFYHSRMRDNGWRKRSDIEDALRGITQDHIMFYSKDSREVHIQVRKDEVTGHVITTVVERKKGTG